jgi:hypothetical protein
VENFDMEMMPKILVQFPEDDAELTNFAALEERSQRAIAKATETIHAMASKVTETIKNIKLSERPHEIEVQFGIELSAEAGALVAHASTTASIIVKLKWERTNAPAPTVTVTANDPNHPSP